MRWTLFRNVQIFLHMAQAHLWASSTGLLQRKCEFIALIFFFFVVVVVVVWFDFLAYCLLLLFVCCCFLLFFVV